MEAASLINNQSIYKSEANDRAPQAVSHAPDGSAASTAPVAASESSAAAAAAAAAAIGGQTHGQWDVRQLPYVQDLLPTLRNRLEALNGPKMKRLHQAV